MNPDMNELMDQVASELLEGIEKKDKQMVRDALKALILHCMDEDEAQDSQDME